jgi:hypothetical protein
MDSSDERMVFECLWSWSCKAIVTLSERESADVKATGGRVSSRGMQAERTERLTHVDAETKSTFGRMFAESVGSLSAR